MLYISSIIMNYKMYIAIAIVLLMIVPASALLGYQPIAPVHNNQSNSAKNVPVSNTFSGANPMITSDQNYQAYKEKNNAFLMHTDMSRYKAYAMSGNSGSTFENLTPSLNVAFNGTAAYVNGIASNQTTIGYLPVPENDRNSYVSVYNGKETHTFYLPNMSLYYIHSLTNGYILAAEPNSPNGKFSYYFVNFTGFRSIDFYGINDSKSVMVATINDSIYIDECVGSSSYFLEYYENGTQEHNFTSLASMPLNFNVNDVIVNNGIMYLGGSVFRSGDYSYALASVNLSNYSFAFLKVWGDANNTMDHYYEAINNIFTYGGNLFLFGMELSFLGGPSQTYASVAYNFTTMNLSSHVFTNHAEPFPNNAIFNLPVSSATIGGNTFMSMENYYCNTNSSNSYLNNFYYLINDTTFSVTNITNEFSIDYVYCGAAAWDGNFYVAGGFNLHTISTVNYVIAEYNITAGDVTIPSFGPAVLRGYPTYWLSQSLQGDNGVLSVGGNGYDFYNSSGFHSAGTVSNSGFLLGAAWNGNEFLMVGQKYFPLEGVLAYIYYPGNNTLVDISSIFSPGLSFNATLFSVSSIGNNFLIAGIMQANSYQHPILYLYNPTDSRLTNLTGSIPSSIKGVTRGETVSSGNYAYVAFEYNGSVWLGYYHSGLLSQVGNIVTNNSFSILTPYFSAWRSDFMVADNGNLYMFGNVHSNESYLEEISYNVSNNSFYDGGCIFMGEGTDSQYAAEFNGNVIIFGTETAGNSVNTIAEAYNVSDHIFSSSFQRMPVNFCNVYGAAQYGSAILVTGGSFANIMYGIWSPDFPLLSSFNNTITFRETGLPSGSVWYVNLTGQSSGPISAGSIYVDELINGSYSYTITTSDNMYEPSLSSGSIKVNGKNLSQTITFTEVKYSITFTESGLPSGTSWSVILNGTKESSTTDTIAFTEPNGTYSYTVNNVSGYSVSPSSGSIKFSGSNFNEAVTFTQVKTTVSKYTITFIESGLPSGTSWSVTVNGTSQSSVTDTISFSEFNGTYSYSISGHSNYVVSPMSGSVTVNGNNTTVDVKYSRYANLILSVSPSSAAISINGLNETMSNGSFSMYLDQGYYYINITESGYMPYSDYVYLSYGNNYTYSISLTQIINAGYLAGTVSPSNATIVANGVIIPVSNGHFNSSLSPGTYYVSFTAGEYSSIVKEINITAGKTSILDISLAPVKNTITLSGYLNPGNASLVVDGFVAYVNSTGYYHISISAGTYTISVYENGYYPYSKNVILSSSGVMNFTLVREPPASSSASKNNTTASGYNVTVSNLTTGNGVISVSFNSSTNGTLIVQIPYADMKNTSISDILNSTVYINRIAYSNFTVSISSNYTIILEVYGLKSGDPVLSWKYSPNGVVSPPVHTTTVSQAPSLFLYEILGAIVAVAIVVAASIAVFSRRRR